MEWRSGSPCTTAPATRAAHSAGPRSPCASPRCSRLRSTRRCCRNRRGFLEFTRRSDRKHMICSGCKQNLTEERFHHETRSSTGYAHYCRDCANAYRRRRWAAEPEYRRRHGEKAKLWHIANKTGHNHSIRAAEVRSRYGLSWDQYESLIRAAKCGLCGCSNPGGKGTWHVDHSHETGVVRGILCHNCNLWLGVYEKFTKKVGEGPIKKYLREANIHALDAA